MKSFLQRYGSRIHGILHGLDRVRFRGTLRALSYVRGMSGFLFGIGVHFQGFRKVRPEIFSTDSPNNS